MKTEHRKNLEAIARLCLGIDTLETRNSDSLDFHDVSAAGVLEALELAYHLGRRDQENEAEA